MGEVRVESLMEALMEIVVISRTHDRRRVRVAGLRPRDVAALDDVVLRIAKGRGFGDRRWKLLEADRVRNTKEIAEVLVVLERVLLPSLAYEDGRALIANGVVSKYVVVLSKLADKCVASDFTTNVKVLCVRLGDYISAAANLDDAELNPLVDLLIKDVTALLDNIAFPERATNAAPVNETLASNDAVPVPAPSRRRHKDTTTAGIRPTSLDAAFKDMAIDVGNHRRRNVWVHEVRPRDVFALLTVAKVAKKMDPRWKVENERRLRSMEKAAGVLLVLEAALLPALTEYPEDTAHLLTALRVYSFDNMSKQAREVGGSFSLRVQTLCNDITDFITSMEEDASSDGTEAEAGEVVADDTGEAAAGDTEKAEADEAAAGDTEKAEADEAAADEMEQKLKALLAKTPECPDLIF
ncbi:unnamed protein product [Urochloa humidicola]